MGLLNRSVTPPCGRAYILLSLLEWHGGDNVLQAGKRAGNSATCNEMFCTRVHEATRNLFQASLMETIYPYPISGVENLDNVAVQNTLNHNRGGDTVTCQEQSIAFLQEYVTNHTYRR